MDRKFWDECAQDLNVRDNWIVDKNFKDEDFVDLLRPRLNGRTLEIGCGIGRLSELYDCGIDISPKMLALAPKDREYKVCDGKSIPYPSESFDSVFCVQVFQHIPNPNDYLKEAYRVLKSGGKFILQYVKGNSRNGSYSYRHTLSMGNWKSAVEFKGISPEWTWMELTK